MSIIKIKMKNMKIGFIGAGKVASKFGGLLTIAGHKVKYGARVPANDTVSIAEAIEFGDVVFLAVPYVAIATLLSENKSLLKGKIIVDMSNPINTDWSPVFLGEDSSGEQTSRILPGSKVVKAFNTVFADIMDAQKTTYNGIKGTAFIASDDHEAALIVKSLADDVGFGGLVINGIKNARYMEAMANLNIAIALNGGGTDAGFIYFQRKG